VQARAELLLPLASRLPRGSREARVPDWSHLDEEARPREILIALDPALSPAENAARWLRRAKRYRSAADRIAGRRAQVQAELSNAKAVLLRAEAAPAAEGASAVELERPAAPAAPARGRWPAGRPSP